MKIVSMRPIQVRSRFGQALPRTVGSNTTLSATAAVDSDAKLKARVTQLVADALSGTAFCRDWHHHVRGGIPRRSRIVR